MSRIALFLTSLILSAIFLPIGIVTTTVVFSLGFFTGKLKRKDAWENFTRHFIVMAIAIDQMGNVFCEDLLNLTLITNDGIPFGNKDETISSVLGRNKLKNTLTKSGKRLDWLLDQIDENHSIESIDERFQKRYNNNDQDLIL